MPRRYQRRLVCAVLLALSFSFAAWLLAVHTNASTGDSALVGSDHDLSAFAVPSDAAPAGLLRQRDPAAVSRHRNRSASGDEQPRIHFITVQTSASPTWCRMLYSALLSGNISVVNLAWGSKYAHIRRPQWILEFLATVPLHDVVLFADGGDTVYTGLPPSHILHAFSGRTGASEPEHRALCQRHQQKGEACLHPVLFNAEANCYHQQTFEGSWGVKKGKCLAAYKRYAPNVTSPYRYLNGGVWIARVWAAVTVFEAAQAIIRKSSHWWCDQSVLGLLLLSRKLDLLLGLDRDNRFFLPTYHLRVKRDFCDDTSTSTEKPGWGAAVEPRMRLCHSGNVPSVIHFNGKSEGRFTSEVLGRTSWSWVWRSTAGKTNATLQMDGVTFLRNANSPRRVSEFCSAAAFLRLS